MTFRIGHNRPISPDGGQIKLRVNLSQSGGSDVAQELNKSSHSGSISSAAGERLQVLEVNNVVGSLSVANSALSAIGDLRSQQLSLVQEAEKTPQGDRLQAINSELGSLQGQIDKIASDANFNDKSTLGANSFEVRIDKLNINEEINTGSATSVVGNLGLDTTSQTAATQSRQTLQDNIAAFLSIKDGFQSALDKSTDILAKVADDLATKNAPSAPSGSPAESAQGDFENLAKKIAGAVGGQFAADKADINIVQSVSGKLTPERVADLLRQ